MEMESKEPKTTQKVSSKKGGLITMPFIIANEALEKVSSFGLHANMVLYLITQYHMDNAPAFNIMFLWGAITNFLPIFGAFLSDAFLGRFRIIALGSVISLLGMIMLWFTSLFPQARPEQCQDKNPANCEPAKPAHLLLLLTSYGIMSIGAAGIRPCSMAFGADQIYNPDNPKNERVLQSFFNWYYASVGISIMIAVTVIVYIQDVAGWIVGFGVPAGLMLVSTVMFLVGSYLYVNVKTNKNLFAGLSHVTVAAWRNRHLSSPPKDFDGWYYHKGAKLVIPTNKLRFLNKACIIQNREKDLNPQGLAIDPWSLCTVKQVEELKAIIKVLPIWSTGIVIAVTISQHSFHLVQARTMDRRLISNFKIPAGSFGVFSIITLTIWVSIYDLAVVPFLSKYTKHPNGLSYKQRMGIGLVISIVATAVSAEVERHRRKIAIHEGFSEDLTGVVSMSAMWLVPQNCLTGLGEAFNAIGQIQFFYSQFPKSMASIAVSLFSVGMGMGNLLGSLIVYSVDHLSKKSGGVSWVSNNLNQGHYDYYYWVITFLCVANFFYFLLCSWAYGSEDDITIWDEEDNMKEETVLVPVESPIVFSA